MVFSYRINQGTSIGTSSAVARPLNPIASAAKAPACSLS
jgi:hypothetical protein